MFLFWMLENASASLIAYFYACSQLFQGKRLNSSHSGGVEDLVA